MRLMLPDVEFAHTEREIDGVDIFERRREKREVGDERDQRKREQRFAQRDQTGRSRSASFRLPLRKPRGSTSTAAKPIARKRRIACA